MTTRYTEQQLLSELTRFHDLHGRMPVSADLNSTNGFPCAETYTRRFGSLKVAKLKARRRC